MKLTLVLTMLLFSSCAIFQKDQPFNPKFISEYYVEECLSLCTSNPEVYLELLSKEFLIYACHCKESVKP